MRNVTVQSELKLACRRHSCAKSDGDREPPHGNNHSGCDVPRWRCVRLAHLPDRAQPRSLTTASPSSHHRAAMHPAHVLLASSDAQRRLPSQALIAESRRVRMCLTEHQTKSRSSQTMCICSVLAQLRTHRCSPAAHTLDKWHERPTCLADSA